MKKIFVAVIVALGLAGFFLLRKPKHVTYAGQLVAAIKPLPEIKLYADNQSIPFTLVHEVADKALHLSLATLSFQVHGKEYFWKPPEVVPAVRAEMLFPCGWKPLTLKVLKVPTSDEIRAAAETGASPRVALSVEKGFPRDWMTLWVDNRGGKQVQLSVGQVSYTIPAGSQDNWDFAVPDCAEGATVKLNGTPIGTVPQRGDPKVSFGGSFLVDASGNRCYRSRSLEYNPQGWTMIEPETHWYRRKRLHGIGIKPNFFLEAAPKVVSPKEFALPGEMPAFVWVYELVEVPCT